MVLELVAASNTPVSYTHLDVYKRQLVALGSMASFLWSVYVLFAMTRAQVDGDSAAVMNYMMEFYFESAAMILTPVSYTHLKLADVLSQITYEGDSSLKIGEDGTLVSTTEPVSYTHLDVYKRQTYRSETYHRGNSSAYHRKFYTSCMDRMDRNY